MTSIALDLPIGPIADRLAERRPDLRALLCAVSASRRRSLSERIASYTECGDDDVAAYATKRGDPLATAIDVLVALIDDGI